MQEVLLGASGGSRGSRHQVKKKARDIEDALLPDAAVRVASTSTQLIGFMLLGLKCEPQLCQVCVS